MEATKKAGIIIDYNFQRHSAITGPPQYLLWITIKNMAALDRGVQEEEVAKTVICSTEVRTRPEWAG